MEYRDLCLGSIWLPIQKPAPIAADCSINRRHVVFLVMIISLDEVAPNGPGESAAGHDSLVVRLREVPSQPTPPTCRASAVTQFLEKIQASTSNKRPRRIQSCGVRRLGRGCISRFANGTEFGRMCLEIPAREFTLSDIQAI